MDSFLQLEREVWNPLGRCCQVPGCQTEVFPTLRKYQSHWREYHNQDVNLTKCKECGKVFSQARHFNHHAEKVHEKNPLDIKIPLEKKNRSFINPGDILPYRKGSMEEEKKIIEEEKRKEAERRRREAHATLARQLPQPEEVMCRDYELHVGVTAQREVKVYRRIKPCRYSPNPRYGPYEKYIAPVLPDLDQFS